MFDCLLNVDVKVFVCRMVDDYVCIVDELWYIGV